MVEAEEKAGFHSKTHTWRSGLTERKLGSAKTPAAQSPKQPNPEILQRNTTSMRGSVARNKSRNPHEVEIAGSNPAPASKDPRSKLQCPECGSAKLWHDGLRYLASGEGVQRWLCRSCGYRFSEPKVKVNVSGKPPKLLKPSDDVGDFGIGRLDFAFQEKPNSLSLSFGENIGSHSPSPPITIVAKSLKALPTINKDCRVCVSEGEAKNLATVESQSEKRAAGATITGKEIEGKLVEFLWWMKRQGYKETTIRSKSSRLRILFRLGANLLDPESVKGVIATQDWADSSKETTVYAYDLFAKYMGIMWERPSYKPPRKLPFIPLEREIDDLIAGCSNKTVSTFLQVAKETGARAGEIFSLKWTDVDFEGRTMRLTPEKGSDPRIFKISNRLTEMLNSLPRRGERVFSSYSSLRSLSCTFERNRKRMAYKLGNPRLLRISFHTLRHWKATMEYHRTKDILHVMQMLGHRNIKNTLIYTQLIKVEGEDEYVCKVARTVEQAAELIEAGFDYVCEIEGVKLFRKRR